MVISTKYMNDQLDLIIRHCEEMKGVLKKNVVEITKEDLRDKLRAPCAGITRISQELEYHVATVGMN